MSFLLITDVRLGSGQGKKCYLTEDQILNNVSVVRLYSI